MEQREQKLREAAEEIHKCKMIQHDECDESVYETWKELEDVAYKATMEAMEEYAAQKAQQLHDRIKELEKELLFEKQNANDFASKSDEYRNLANRTNSAKLSLQAKLKAKDEMLQKMHTLILKLDKWSTYPKDEIIELTEAYHKEVGNIPKSGE